MKRTKNALLSVMELDAESKQNNKIIGEVRNNIVELSERSKNITNIVKVIYGVADQTRLLREKAEQLESEAQCPREAIKVFIIE